MKTKILIMLMLVMASCVPAIGQGDSVKIGNQYWRTENCRAGDGVFYKINGVVVDSTLGKLYTFAQLGLTPTNKQGPCGSGWHVPDTTEFETLLNVFGSWSAAWKALKAVGYANWYCGYTYKNYTTAQKAALNSVYGGTDMVGFNMKGTGYSPSPGWFNGIRPEGTMSAYFWTSSSRNKWSNQTVDWAVVFYFSFYPAIQKYANEKDQRAFPVRCIKNN